jgi:hypothetical protein
MTYVTPSAIRTLKLDRVMRHGRRERVSQQRPTAEELRAVGDLLALAKQHGVTIVFTPNAEGWIVGYMYLDENSALIEGSTLAGPYDLRTAVKVALPQLKEIISQVEIEQRDREEAYLWEHGTSEQRDAVRDAIHARQHQRRQQP